MFVMMNEARLGVGLQGQAMGEIAYQNAVRLCPRTAAGPLAVGCQGAGQEGRPDHRASRTCAGPDDDPRLQRGRPRLHAVDRAEIRRRPPSEVETDRQQADDLMTLVTPVVKGVLTDKGFDHAVMAQQMFGGHGYIEEWGMSQYVRDARIAMIYEGANGIQALDLVGRKLGQRRPRSDGLLQGSRRFLRGKPQQ
jgi:acyl-CoA dehydrogenase